MSNFFICRKALVTRCTFAGSRSVTMSMRVAEFVLEPAAGALFAARAQLVPEIVDLLLGLTVDLEGDGLAEFELWAAGAAYSLGRVILACLGAAAGL